MSDCYLNPGLAGFTPQGHTISLMNNLSHDVAINRGVWWISLSTAGSCKVWLALNALQMKWPRWHPWCSHHSSGTFCTHLACYPSLQMAEGEETHLSPHQSLTCDSRPNKGTASWQYSEKAELPKNHPTSNTPTLTLCDWSFSADIRAEAPQHLACA